MRTLAGVPLSLVLLHGPAGAATIHVPVDQPTIQAGIDAAVAGDIVLVAAGIYSENLVMKSGVVLTSEMGAGATRISAAASASGIRCINVTDATIEGFTITGGGGSWVDNVLVGGGILCLNSSPLIRQNQIENCRIYGNGTEYLQAGGGIACLWESSPLIEDNEISHNSLEATYSEFYPHTAGGGIYCDGTSPAVIRRCMVLGNTAGNGGAGGVHSESPAVLLEDCTLLSNTGLEAGGFARSGTLRRCVVRGNTGDWPYGTGGCSVDGEAQILDCLIIGNSGGTWIQGGGGGITTWRGPVVVSGNTIVGNRAPTIAGLWVGYLDQEVTIERNIVVANGQDGAGWGVEASAASLRCNDVWGNAAGNYSYEDPTGVDGNISVDPLFCDAEADNLTLDGGSPCLPGQHPGGYDCGLIGALQRGCGATAVSPSTWGRMKSRFVEH